MKAAPKTCAILCLHLLVLLIFFHCCCCCCCCCSCCGRCHFGRDRRGKTHLKHEHEKHLHKIVLTHLPPHRSRCRRRLFRPWPRTRQRCGKGPGVGRGVAVPAAPLGQINYTKCRRWARSVGHFMANLICLQKIEQKGERAEFNGRGQAQAGAGGGGGI